ncbi:MAG: N-acetylmuramoyl-L-alanine amidase [Blautia sp.]
MRESWKRVLTIILALAMLFTNCSPVLGAEESEQTAETEIPCNYIFTQNDGEYQSVILEIGDEDTTVLDGAVLTYQDGNGDFIKVQAEEVKENLAAFLIPVAAENVQREFIAAEAVVQGTIHAVKMDSNEEMKNVEVSEEQAASVVEEVQEEETDTESFSEEELDTDTAQQVQQCVITSEEGMTAEDIESAIEETNNLPVTESQENETLSEKPEEKDHYIVVLDPGHGGSDGGAENAYGEESESILTLKIGTYLKAELEKYTELSVFMTREDDTYVGLSERVEYAVDKKADILVSLHLNSYESSSANGAEILVPRTGRYNTEVAENAEHLANNILKRITSLGLYDRGLKYRDSASGGTYPDGSTSDYYTIIEKGMRAGIPSIIVEHAFISSEQDAQYLDSEEDLMNFAKADAYGIAQYFGIETGGEEYEEVPKPVGEWKKINGKWYYYIGNVKQTGWIEVDGKWYYLDADGVMQTGWKKIGSSWYYMNGAGVMQTGWKKIDGKWYYLNSSGVMQTGWKKIGGFWYYMNGAGVMQTGWRKIDSKWYYLDADGVMQTGWQRLSKKWYYFNEEDGVMLTNWQEIDGKWYYLDADGVMQTGWKKSSGKWYYLNGAGEMVTGWKRLSGKWYYFDENGAMLTNWQEIDGKWYYLNSDGVMQTGWKKSSGNWYYLNGAGEMVTGWKKIDGKRYYFNESGIMQTGWQHIEGEWYYFNASGEWNPDAKREEENNQTENLYTIMGETSASEEQMIKDFEKSGYDYPAEELEKGGAGDITTFCNMIKEEAETEGVRAEVLFVQVMKETGWLQYGGDVKITQFNFGGLGATGNGEAGESFPDVRTGLRAQVQHLKAYGSEEALVNECVDTRFTYVTRNCAPYVEWLGIQENPDHVGWASSERYGYELVEMINTLKTM